MPPPSATCIVAELAQARVVNANMFGASALTALPFEPVNDETDALIAAFTGSYTTTAKRQIDRLITELKSAGIWSKLDWYGNALWATTEHDALLNWTNPAQTLTKVGGASWIAGSRPQRREPDDRQRTLQVRLECR